MPVAETHDHCESMDVREKALEAGEKIRKHVTKTPLEFSPWISQRGDAEVCLKLENLQLTGSLKSRGGINEQPSIDHILCRI
jgi:threonine dehydratase